MIHFFSENDYLLNNKDSIINWIERVVEFHQGKIEQLNYIFCDDEYLLKINKEFLEHDYYTDIITFDNSIGKNIDGEIFISTERVKDNSNKYNVSFDHELKRVIIHGVLHLLGFKDKSEEQQKLMTLKENEALISFK